MSGGKSCSWCGLVFGRHDKVRALPGSYDRVACEDHFEKPELPKFEPGPCFPLTMPFAPTERDWFAVNASDQDIERANFDAPAFSDRSRAAGRYRVADAMLAERAKRAEPEDETARDLRLARELGLERSCGGMSQFEFKCEHCGQRIVNFPHVGEADAELVAGWTEKAAPHIAEHNRVCKVQPLVVALKAAHRMLERCLTEAVVKRDVAAVVSSIRAALPDSAFAVTLDLSLAAPLEDGEKKNAQDGTVKS